MIVLIVDDDEEDLEILCEAIKYIDKSTTCIAATDGQGALDILQRYLVMPDFIFLDINMPGMGGMECLKAIKMDDRLMHIPIIMNSTTSDKKEISLFREQGAGFLVKPTSYNLLVKALELILNGTLIF